MCDLWNGVCQSELYLVQGRYCRFQCGNVVDVVEDGGAAMKRRKGVGGAVMVGTWLAFWGVLVVAVGVLG